MANQFVNESASASAALSQDKDAAADATEDLEKASLAETAGD